MNTARAALSDYRDLQRALTTTLALLDAERRALALERALHEGTRASLKLVLRGSSRAAARSIRAEATARPDDLHQREALDSLPKGA